MRILFYFLFFIFLVVKVLYPHFDKEITVAVVDTGVNYHHPGLKGKVVNGVDFLDFDSDPMDIDGHGTHVAGLITMQNPKAKILPIRFIHDDVHNSYGVRSSLPILYAILAGADVVNMSFSDFHDVVEEKIIRFGHRLGVTFVASAGNDGKTVHNYPASYPYVISVGSYDLNTNDLTDWSNYSNRINYLTPGSNMYSFDLKNSYVPKEGTSMSSAYLSGLISKLLTVGHKPNEIKEILDEKSFPITTSRNSKVLKFKSIDSKVIFPKNNEPILIVKKPNEFTKNYLEYLSIFTSRFDHLEVLQNDIPVKINSPESIPLKLINGINDFKITAKNGSITYSDRFTITLDKTPPSVDYDVVKDNNKNKLSLLISDRCLASITLNKKDLNFHDNPEIITVDLKNKNSILEVKDCSGNVNKKVIKSH